MIQISKMVTTLVLNWDLGTERSQIMVAKQLLMHCKISFLLLGRLPTRMTSKTLIMVAKHQGALLLHLAFQMEVGCALNAKITILAAE